MASNNAAIIDAYTAEMMTYPELVERKEDIGERLAALSIGEAPMKRKANNKKPKGVAAAAAAEAGPDNSETMLA